MIMGSLPQDLRMPGTDYARLVILSIMVHFIMFQMNHYYRCPWGHGAQAASHYLPKSCLENAYSTQSPTLPATKP